MLQSLVRMHSTVLRRLVLMHLALHCLPLAQSTGSQSLVPEHSTMLDLARLRSIVLRGRMHEHLALRDLLLMQSIGVRVQHARVHHPHYVRGCGHQFA